MSDIETRDVCIVGGGVAGLTAGIFTARAGLDTLILTSGEPILARNAHLENVPGFPAGVNARTFLEMTQDQAERNGCTVREASVTSVDPADRERLSVSHANQSDDARLLSDYVLCTSWSDTDYLAHLDEVGLIDRGSKTYVETDDRGATDVDGLYAAGRIAETHHQTVVAAGDGATAALSIVEDSEVPFYHDWVAPEGYFSGRDRDVPPGCEEIDEDERAERERESMAVMQEYFAEPVAEEPTQHPSVRD